MKHLSSYFLIFFIIFITVNSAELGNIVSFEENNNEFLIETKDGAHTKVIFYRDDIFRIWVSPDRSFNDLAGSEQTPIVIYNDKPIKTDYKDKDEYYQIETESCFLRVYKNPCKFSLFEKDNTTLLFEEVTAITYGDSTFQSIKKNENDYFYGCGMQNGHFCHNDREVQIENIYNDKIWEEHGTPNAASFYMTLNGYGVFRNTYNAGKYDFKEIVKTSHRENGFDGYYFVGDLKEILEGYTLITGRPFLTPQWGLEFGDADRYNEGSYECISFADQYIEKDIPVGWFLPNDGYGMDFSRIPEVSKELHKRGIIPGMWTDKGLDFKKYVSEYDIRLFKLDIAWVGVGTKFSMNACRTVYEHLEKNSGERGMIWVTLGWSGNQRYSIMWTGDNGYKRPNDWIRWHIPTMIGSGLSAQNAATGDIDGIYAGNADRYLRDLQWKTFTTNMMIIDNWKVAGEEWKKPWSYGEPYTYHNRNSLKLKSRLIPYLYTYCHEAYETGVPLARAFVLEFPEDPKTWDEKGDKGATKHQFMVGEWLLVAPVYKQAETKKWSFYLPRGKWTDFFTGKVYDGNKTVTDYDISDYKYPILVREGGIIPMYPESFYDSNNVQRKPIDPLTLDIYPGPVKSSFELMEDDGVTYRFKTDSLFNKTLIECEKKESGIVAINIKGQYKGKGYKGMPEKRNYILSVHGEKPKSVSINKAELSNVSELSKLDNEIEGWYFENEKSKIHIKIRVQEAKNNFKVFIRINGA